MPMPAMPVSMVDNLVLRPSGPWIDRKYHYLRKYLDILTKGMKKRWSGALTYIDLFAGPGRCLIVPGQVERNGSPLLALGREFARYVFVESDPRCLEALRKRCDASPQHPKIIFLAGDCNAVIDQVKPDGLSLAFIDPTGIDIHLKTIETLSRGHQVDLLINVQVMDIRRNLVRYRRPGSKLDRFLGGGIETQTLRTPHDVIALYKKRIHALGYGTVEFKDIMVRNVERNAPLYFLLFASKHPRGLDFWSKITAKDESGQLEFF